MKNRKRHREAIRLAWSSLDSHLKYAHSAKLGKGETRKFHRKCCREYAKIITALCKKL